MPIFEFRCQNCGDDFELLVRNMQVESACPGCGSAKLHKKFSVFGFKSGGEPAMATSSSSSCGHCSGHNCSGCHH